MNSSSLPTTKQSLVPQQRRKWLQPPRKYKTKWIVSRLTTKEQREWKWPRDIRAALEYHTPRPKVKGEVGVWHNKSFYWVFSIDSRHTINIYRAFIPHPRLWIQYKLNEPRWLYVKSIAIPYRDSPEWATGIQDLRRAQSSDERVIIAKLIRYRNSNVAFGLTDDKLLIGIAYYEGYGREYKFSRKCFYWPRDAAETGFKILEGLLRQQQIAGGLLYMKDGDEIVEVDDYYDDEPETEK